MSNSALNSNVVKTALDKLFFQKWDYTLSPGRITVEDQLVFNQGTSDRAAEIMEVNRGTGLWDSKSETQNVPTDTYLAVNNTTYTHTTFAKALDLPKEYFDDDLHMQVKRNIQDIAAKGRQTQNFRGFSTYRNAFNSAFPGADGVSLISTAHPIATGVESNEVANNPALSEDSINTMIVQLMEQKDQGGVIMGDTPTCLLVPPALFKLACEIVDSELRSGTADNDVNVYSSKYGIYVKQSEQLGAASGGSDTAYFLLAQNHGVMRFVRESINTHLLSYTQTANHNYRYTGRYRESTGFTDYAGIIGSDGTGV